MGDERLEAFGYYPLFNFLLKQLGAHTGAELPLSQAVALLIERWYYMTPEEQGALIRLLHQTLILSIKEIFLDFSLFARSLAPYLSLLLLTNQTNYR